MAEQRKPDFTLVAAIRGKRRKYSFELYPATLWPKRHRSQDIRGRTRYRLRINGKWMGKGFTTITLTDFMRIMRGELAEFAERMD